MCAGVAEGDRCRLVLRSNRMGAPLRSGSSLDRAVDSDNSTLPHSMGTDDACDEETGTGVRIGPAESLSAE